MASPSLAMRILIVKTGALGDVLRTTSILPGLHRRYPDCRVTWVTARGAEDLVRYHPLVDRVHAVSPDDGAAIAMLGDELSTSLWDRVLSFDDEEALCGLATRLTRKARPGVLSGAYLDEAGVPRYTPDVAPWFDMGLLSVHGKEEADRRKAANRESHPVLFARMLGIKKGETELPLSERAFVFATGFAELHGLYSVQRLVGLNTGAGGRWDSKRLSVERTVELAERIHRRLEGDVAFLVLGGPEEAERNAEILARGKGRMRFVDGGTGNSLLQFAALIDVLDLLICSDSLALHMAIARKVKVLAFFAPTSAAEIELYGRGAKVASTAPDYCSYRRDADTSTLTVDRLAPVALRLLGCP